MDYCTWFPEGWWGYCCEAHDAAYAAQIGKEIADSALLQCVASSNPSLAAASLVIASMMYAGVRIFGTRYYNNAKK
jgi:hypothetical protein